MTLVGFGWDGSDERKMRRTFGAGCGRASFGAFCDLQVRLQAMGAQCYFCCLHRVRAGNCCHAACS